MAQGGDMTLCSRASPEEGETDAPFEWGAHLAEALGKGMP